MQQPVAALQCDLCAFVVAVHVPMYPITFQKQNCPEPHPLDWSDCLSHHAVLDLLLIIVDFLVLLLQEPPVLPGLLYQHMQQPAASSRIAASLVILHWLQLVAARCRDAVAAAAPKPDPDTEASAADPSSLNTVVLSAVICGEVPEALPDTCLAYLGAPSASMPSPPAADPYSEVAPLYARMRKDLYALVNASLQVGYSTVTHGNSGGISTFCAVLRLHLCCSPSLHGLSSSCQQQPFCSIAGCVAHVACLYCDDRCWLRAQVGAVLTSPSGIPLELVNPEGAVAMAAAVPPEADVGDVAQAKVAVLQSATHVQVQYSSLLEGVPLQCLHTVHWLVQP